MLNFESKNFIQFGVLGASIEDSLRGSLDRVRQYQMPMELKYEAIYFDESHVNDICPKGKFELINSELNFFSTKNSTHTIYTSDLQDGWHSLFCGLSKDLNCKSIWIRSSGDIDKRDQYVQNFEIYEHGNLKRMVNLYWDRKWIFCERGEVLDIENKFKYVDVNVKARLCRLDLMNILAKYFPNLKLESGLHGYRLNFDHNKI